MVDGLSPDELKDARRRERHQYPAVVVRGEDLRTEGPIGDMLIEAAVADATLTQVERASGGETVYLGSDPDSGRSSARSSDSGSSAPSEDDTVWPIPTGEPIPVGYAVQQAVDALAAAGRPTVQPEPDSMRAILGRECKDLSVAGMSKLSQAMGALCGNDYEAALDIISDMTEGDVDPGIAVMYTLIQMLMAVGTNYQLIKLAERDQRGLERTRQSGYAAWEKYPSAGEPS